MYFATDEDVQSLRNLARTLPHQLRAIDEAAMSLGLKASEWAMWQEIAQPGGTTSAWMVSALRLDPATVSKTLHLWERYEKFVATRPEEHNRRIKRAELTRGGRDLDRDLQERANHVARAMLDRLIPSERNDLLTAAAVIGRLLARVDPRWNPVTIDHV